MKFVGTAVDSPSGACSTVYCAKVSGITFVYAKIVDSSFVRTKVAGSTSVCTKVAGTTFGSPPRGMHPIQLHQGCRQHVSSTRRSPLAVSSARRSPAARPSSRKTPRTPSRILGSAIHLGVAAYLGLRPLTADGRGMSSPCRSPRSRSGILGSGHSLRIRSGMPSSGHSPRIRSEILGSGHPRPQLAESGHTARCFKAKAL